ncbi:MAG: hypothetical protein NZ959_05260 [Armatimonadetes bacterium]|nr:hypothetical protein [Armatimonadota bacterium]MDW8122256.1 hypothetical protein [Armatimonadota bacterium]
MRGTPWWVIPLIGLFIVAVADGALYFLLIRRQTEELASKAKTKQEYENTIARRQAVEEDLKRAKEEAAQARKRWAAIAKELVLLKYPDPANPQEIWEVGLKFQYEARGHFERDLRKYLAELANECGVELRYDQVPRWTGVTLQLPPEPNTGYFLWGQMVLLLDGRYRDILNFLSRLPRFTRPILVHTPTFSLLQNGRLRATVPISIYSLVETAVERAVLAGKPPPTGALPGAAAGATGTAGLGTGVGVSAPMMPMGGGAGAPMPGPMMPMGGGAGAPMPGPMMPMGGGVGGQPSMPPTGQGGAAGGQAPGGGITAGPE